MRTITEKLLRVWLGPLALIVAAGLLGTFRPVLRFHSQRPSHSGVYQPILPSEITESGADGRPSLVRNASFRQGYHSIALLALLVSVVTLALKTHRTTRAPIAIRRLKLPRATADSSPSS